MPELPFPGNDEVNRDGNTSWYEYARKPDFFKRVAELSVPALFVHAGADVRPRWPAEQLANLVEGSEQVCIEHASHYIWFAHSAELSQVLRRFLKRILASPTQSEASDQV